jgi:hypothetical protein
LNFLTGFLDKKIKNLNKKVDNVMKENREEVQENVQNRSQGIPGLSTLMESSSSESNSSTEQLNLNLSKHIDRKVIDLSFNLWSGRYLNTKDTAFEEVAKQKHFHLKESRYYGLLKQVVEDKLKVIDAVELTSFEKISMANPGSSITLELVLKHSSREVWNETEMAVLDAVLYSESVQSKRRLKQHNNCHKS